MKAINRKDFNPETMPYQETQIVSRYDYYSNKLSFGEKKIFKKPNGKLVYIMFRTHSIVVPKEHLKKQSHYVTQMAKSYFQQDDMMETKQKTVIYCDKVFINQQKELVKQMWDL